MTEVTLASLINVIKLYQPNKRNLSRRKIMSKFAIRARWQNHTVKLRLTYGLVERGETTEGGAMYAGKIICALSSLVKD